MAKQGMTIHDIVALSYFMLLWTGFSHISGGQSRLVTRKSLTQLMNAYRGEWLRTALRRDLRMIDTQILAGLQNGTGFFASSTIFALGGCFALLGATDRVMMIYQDLPVMLEGGRTAFELKVGGLALIFGYAFFKFGWSYRLFNYCSIRFGSIPMAGDAIDNPDHAQRILDQVITLNIVAGRHFSAGLRAIFLAIGYLGWFVSPYAFVVATSLVILVLVRRQYFSDARAALMDGETA
jgi:uncharacterized membrane protein